MDRSIQGPFPITRDWRIRQGTIVDERFALFAPNSDGVAVLIDTNGWTGTLTVRDRIGGARLFSWPVTVGIRGALPDQWNLWVRIPATTTAGYTAGYVGVFDLKVTPGDTAEARVLFSGRMTIDGEVTV